MSYVIKLGCSYFAGQGEGFVECQRSAVRFDSRSYAEHTADTVYDGRMGERVVKIVPRKRPATLRDQVAEFHAMIGEPAPIAPEVPNVDAVRLRLSLVSEEFYEVASEFMPALHTKHYFKELQKDMVQFTNDAWQNKISLPKLAKELSDLAYVIEGTFQALGIDSSPILAEVHRSNMAKRGAGKDANGKWQKPPGWNPPDIAGELRKQGWKGGAK